MKIKDLWVQAFSLSIKRVYLNCFGLQHFKPLFDRFTSTPICSFMFLQIASDEAVSWHPDRQSRTLALFSHSTKKYVQMQKWAARSPMHPPEPIF